MMKRKRGCHAPTTTKQHTTGTQNNFQSNLLGALGDAMAALLMTKSL